MVIQFVTQMAPAFRRGRATVVLAVFFLFDARPILACPWCRSASGVNSVAAEIFNESFWLAVTAILAPFPVLAAIVAAIYFTPSVLESSDE
jgi:hypothetical protein